MGLQEVEEGKVQIIVITKDKEWIKGNKAKEWIKGNRIHKMTIIEAKECQIMHHLKDLLLWEDRDTDKDKGRDTDKDRGRDTDKDIHLSSVILHHLLHNTNIHLVLLNMVNCHHRHKMRHEECVIQQAEIFMKVNMDSHQNLYTMKIL